MFIIKVRPASLPTFFSLSTSLWKWSLIITRPTNSLTSKVAKLSTEEMDHLREACIHPNNQWVRWRIRNVPMYTVSCLRSISRGYWRSEYPQLAKDLGLEYSGVISFQKRRASDWTSHSCTITYLTCVCVCLFVCSAFAAGASCGFWRNEGRL